jgi:hypothetical protein
MSIVMIFIFGFAKFYSLENKIEHFENPKIFSDLKNFEKKRNFEIFEKS